MKSRSFARQELTDSAIALWAWVLANRDQYREARNDGTWTQSGWIRTCVLEARLQRLIAGATELVLASGVFLIVPQVTQRALEAAQDVLETLEGLLTLLAQIASATGALALEKPPAPPLEVRPQIQAIAPTR